MSARWDRAPSPSNPARGWFRALNPWSTWKEAAPLSKPSACLSASTSCRLSRDNRQLVEAERQADGFDNGAASFHVDHGFKARNQPRAGLEGDGARSHRADIRAPAARGRIDNADLQLIP